MIFSHIRDFYHPSLLLSPHKMTIYGHKGGLLLVNIVVFISICAESLE